VVTSDRNFAYSSIAGDLTRETFVDTFESALLLFKLVELNCLESDFLKFDFDSLFLIIDFLESVVLEFDFDDFFLCELDLVASEVLLFFRSFPESDFESFCGDRYVTSTISPYLFASLSDSILAESTDASSFDISDSASA
jgi:hypothetical protein